VTPDISLAAVILAVTDGEPRLLAVDRGERPALPSGPLPDATPTLELGLRGWVREQTGFELGYVEQLYTFGDLRRDPGASRRHLAIAYLALVREAATAPGARWVDVYDLFPWEDRRAEATSDVVDDLARWAAGDPDRLHRTRVAFGLDGAPWDGIRCLDRYELLYEAGLVAEFHHDRGSPPGSAVPSTALATDHRRIAATALSRVRGKLTYRPVVFELLPDEFTLRELQRVVEALAGDHLHTQNFRRLVESGGLVEPTGRQAPSTGGRPATLHRFRAEVLLERPRPGVGRPSAWG
jgi:hypothetical protein